MIRNAVVFLLMAFGGFFLGLYVAYHEFDPCHALAVERARRAPVPADIAEVWTAIATEHRDRLSCTRALIESWRQRLAEQDL
jgi:hypothetical protein